MSIPWPVKTLGELCNIFNGNSIPAKIKKEKYLIDQEGLPYIGTKDVGFDNEITYDTGVIIPPSDYDNFRLAPAECTFICAEGGSAGRKIGFTEQEVFFGNKLYAIIPNSELISKFVYYFCQSEYFKEQFFSHMSGMIGGVNQKKFKSITIPIPPIEEQQRIVSIIDEAFRNIGRRIQQVGLKAESGSELLQSIVESVFSETGDGWIDTTLGDISEIIMGQSPKGDSYNSEGFGVPLINGPVEFGANPFSKTLRTKFTTAPTKMCEVNDLILCVRGSTTGRMNIAGYKSCIGRGVAAIRSNEHQNWVNHFINFNRNHIYSLGTGATFPNISKDSIAKIRIPIPPDNERKLLVSKLQNISVEIDLLDSKITQELNSLEELKQSILQEAFSGKLTGGITA